MKLFSPSQRAKKMSLYSILTPKLLPIYKETPSPLIIFQILAATQMGNIILIMRKYNISKI